MGVTLVTGAGSNGAQRESAERPRALDAGRPFPLAIEMHFTSWVFPKGHRIRLAVSNSQWPMFWPTPYPVTTSLRLGEETKLLLPVVPAAERPRPDFLPPEEDPQLPGFESVDEETTRYTGKKQNRPSEYKDTIAMLHAHGISVWGSFVFGFDTDDPEVFDLTRENMAQIVDTPKRRAFMAEVGAKGWL